jgi:hypothetical protein
MHVPVGNIVKMAEQDMATPFHSQYRKAAVPPVWPSWVRFRTSKQGSEAYQRVSNKEP